MKTLLPLGVVFLLAARWTSGQELLQNPGFESLSGWECWDPVKCSLSDERHSGEHGLEVTNRQQNWHGPTQYIQTTPGHVYEVSGYIKLLNGDDQNGVRVDLELEIEYTDGNHDYKSAASKSRVKPSDGWIQVSGAFTAPTKAVTKIRIYYQVSVASVNYIVDDASMVEISNGQTEEGELLRNGGFEYMGDWDCWDPVVCTLVNDKQSGQHAFQITARQQTWMGPSQYVNVTAGHVYAATGYVKLLNDKEGQVTGQKVEMVVAFTFTDNSNDYETAGSHSGAKVADGWIRMTGSVKAPTTKPIKSARFYFQGPDPSINFLVDQASLKDLGAPETAVINFDNSIEKIRKSDITLRISTSGHFNSHDVTIHLVQTNKSFPFGTAVAAGKYNDQQMTKYRDFIHGHFNWAVPENSLKWYSIEPNQGHRNFKPALDMINGLRAHGVKVRGHNLVWSVDQYVQNWVKQLPPDQLRVTVKAHIEDVMNVTRGLLEHWDVNNENLHGQFFQNRLNDTDYNLELFRIAHAADPNPKLFLNDYNVVATGYSTDDYLQQALQFKAAKVGLYGLGVQCHFGENQEPDGFLIKQRLDTLAEAGLPIWATELDVVAQDANKRADLYETALKALYAHPSVEGIMFWGFWDQSHWRGEKASLVTGSNLEPNAAGERVLDLFERQWMTDELVAFNTTNHVTVRGFQGDYQLYVLYKGEELKNLTQSFTLGKSAHSININVH